MHLKSRNKVSTVKWQSEKNNRRRSEINTGKTSARNGWGAFFTSFCSISHLSQQRNCSHATQGRWKFIQIFLSSFFFSIRSPMCFKDIVIDIDRVVIIIITIIIIIYCYYYYYYYYYYYDIFIRSYFPGYLFSS